MITRILLALLIALFIPAAASANGSYSHVHISEIATAALAVGDLKSLLMEADNTAAYRAGSMFPDSGYAIDDAYGEVAHWSPFLMTYLEDLRLRYGADFSSQEARREVAFLMGVASHGLGDQIYDTTLLAREFEVDGPEDPARPADVYADYFMIVDQSVRAEVEAWAPYSALPANFATLDGADVDESTLMRGMERMQAVISLQLLVADSLYLDAWAAYPWLGTHIYNPEAVGSLPWTGEVVARYWGALWKRLQGRASVDEDLVVATHPEDGGVGWPVSAEERGALGKIGLVLGYGTMRSQLAERVSLRPVGGEPVSVTIETAYGGEDRNLFFLIPSEPLSYDTEYEVRLDSGLLTISGDQTSRAWSFSFRTRCAPDRLDDCPALPPELVTGPVPSGPPPTEPSPPEEADGDAALRSESGGCAVPGQGEPRGGSGLLFSLVACGLCGYLRRRKY